MTSTGVPSSVTRAERRVGSRLVGRSMRHPRRRGVDHDDVVTRRQHEDGGQTAAQDSRSRSGGRAPGDRDVRRQRDAAEDRTVGQTRRAAAPPARRTPTSSEHCAGDDGGDEGAGSHGTTKLLDHHDELGESETRAALVLGQVEPEPTQPGQVVPERGKALVLRFEQGARRTRGVPLGQEVRGRLSPGRDGLR